MAEPIRPPLEYLAAAGIVTLTTAIAVFFRDRLGTIDVAMVYLLAVVVVSSRFRSGPSLLAAAGSVAALDFFFVPPYNTFNVHDDRYWLTFIVMLVVAVAMGRLTGRIRRDAEEAGARERLASARAALQQALGGVTGPDELLGIAGDHLSRVAGTRAEVLIDDGAGGDGPGWVPASRLSVEAGLMANTAFRSGQSIGWGTGRYADADLLAIPIKGGGRTVGVTLIRPEGDEPTLDDERRRILEALSGDLGAALERAIATERHAGAREELETERLRTALLSALSHDLRSPLASIEGAASSLLDDDAILAEPARRELSETILEESRRMHRMVGNLLDLVRVEAGLLAVHKSWQPLEEVVGVALLRLADRLAGHPIEIRLPADLPLVPIDELLIEQVFINLLDNVVKYTPAETAVRIGARVVDGAVEVEVADRGPGIPPGEEDAIFRRFYRARSADGAVGGSGLGLTICRGIIAAHGGRIWVEPGRADGTTIRFTLPIGDTPPPPVEQPALEPR